MKAYLISVTTATALFVGFGGGLATSGLVVSAAVDNPRHENINACISPTARMSLESVVDSQLCAKVDNKLGLAGPSVCRASDHAKRICFTWQRGNNECPLHANGSLSFPGTWTPGPPQ